MGWVMLEAMASGLPLVATAIDAVPTFVHHNKNGLLIDIRDAEGLARRSLFLPFMFYHPIQCHYVSR